MKSIAIVIPAYNEKENILRLVQSIRKKINCIIVIVDDSSDLITKKIIKKSKIKNLLYFNRGKKSGRGSAVLFGFKKILQLKKKVDCLIEMDADFSHSPSELKKNIVFITHYLDESLRLGDHIGILNAGKLVQVGTPVDIIMNPADDYVKAFVKDVNRAKVIKAKVIMKDINNANDIDKSSLIKVNEDQFIEEFLPQIVCSNSNCEVVDKSGNVKGYISNKELQSSLTKS